MITRLFAILALIPSLFATLPAEEIPEQGISIVVNVSSREGGEVLTQLEVVTPEGLEGLSYVTPTTEVVEEATEETESMEEFWEDTEQSTEATETLEEFWENAEETTEETESMEEFWETTEETEATEAEESVEEPEQVTTEWNGEVLTARNGYNYGPSGKETWYDIKMGGVVKIMRDLGYSEEEYPYWVREDGCKMFGPYIMVAGDIRNTRTRGDIVETSLGTAMVCDHCAWAEWHNPTQLDIATDWVQTYSRRK